MEQKFELNHENPHILKGGQKDFLPLEHRAFSLAYMVENAYEFYASIVLILHNHFEVNDSISLSERSLILKDLPTLHAAFHFLGLSNSARLTLLAMESPEYKDAPGYVVNLLLLLQKSFKEEFTVERFFALTVEEMKAYTETEPFGAIVSRKFPKLKDELKEMNRCFAVGRYTGCVFHSMRTLEFGVQILAKHLNVRYTEEKAARQNGPKKIVLREWGPTIEEILSKINRMPMSTDAEIATRDDHERMAEHLSNVRMERNRVMHARFSKTPQFSKAKARYLKDEVHHFMFDLAHVLDGKPLQEFLFDGEEITIKEANVPRLSGTRIVS